MNSGKSNGRFDIVGPISLFLSLGLFATGLLVSQNVTGKLRVLAWSVVAVGALVIALVLLFTFYRPIAELRKVVLTLQNHLEGIQAHTANQGVSWEEFTVRVLLLAGKVWADKFDPDIVVGVGRSGAIVAGMLGGFLGLKPILCVDTDWHAPKTQERPLTPASLAALKGLDLNTRILLVQAEQDSGESVRQVVKVVADKEKFRSATLWKRERGYPPHYWVDESESKPRWPFRVGAFHKR